MANTSVPTAPFLSSNQVVPPNCKDIPLRDPLTNLTPDELAGAILSTYFNRIIMPQVVTVNTIIWQNWDEIFTKTKFDWEVVLAHPDCVKLRYYLKPIWYVCRPSKKKKDLYEAVLLNKRGKVSRKLSTMSLSLYEAVNLCEDDIHDSSKEGDFAAENNLYRNPSRDDLDYTMYYYLLRAQGKTEIEIQNIQSASFQNTLSALRKLGLSNDYVDYVKMYTSPSYAGYADYLEEKLRVCVAPTPEELQSIATLYTNNLDLLSRKDVWLVKNKNKPIITHEVSVDDSVAFGVQNWSNLTSEEREARRKKAYEALEGKI